MEVLRTGFDLDGFFRNLAHAARSLLLLDYDGTLAPFRVRRDQAKPYRGVRERIEELLRAQATRVVFVSGRSVADLLPLLDLGDRPEIWGAHGWERHFPGGRTERVPVDPEARRVLEEALAWTEEAGIAERVEAKPASVAVHWRGYGPRQIREIRAKAEEAWKPLEGEGGMELHPFDGGLELRVPGRDKGDAVRTLLEESGEDVGAAYLGDDLTDEDAFRAMKDRGVAVLVRSHPRKTDADVRLTPPGEMLAFLDRWAGAANQGERLDPGEE